MNKIMKIIFSEVALALLTLVFVVLKITGNINWSWWWVFSPLWGGFILVVLLATLIALLKK